MQQVKFGSAAIEGKEEEEEEGADRGRWFPLALQQDGVFQLVEARHRAALALPRI